MSADALLVSAFAAQAVAHKPVQAVQHDAAPAQNHFQDSLHYSPAAESGGLFEGVAAQPIHTQPVSAAATAAQPVTPAGGQKQEAPIQKSEAVQSSSTAQTVPVAASAVNTVATTAAVSTATTTSSQSATTQQLTGSLTAANGPPASVAVSQASSNQSLTSSANTSNGSQGGTSSPVSNANPQDLYSAITTAIAAINGGGSSASQNLGTVSLDGIVTMTNVDLSFTLQSGKVTSVSITADSATISFGGGIATATVGSSGSTNITGSYTAATSTFSLTLNNVRVTLASFVNVGADSMTLTYTGGSSTQVNLINPTASTPTGTDTVSLLTLTTTNAYAFAGINGTSNQSSTAPASQGSTAEGLSISGVNLALALMSSTGSGSVYYGLTETGGTATMTGLPGPISMTVSNISIAVNGSNTSANGYVVNFDSSFTSGPGGKGLSLATGGTPSSIVLDFNQPLVQAGATVDLSLNGFVYVMGSMSFQTVSAVPVNLTDGTSTTTNGVTTVSDNGTATVSLLEVAASNVTVFAGINGPTSGNPGVIPANAIGVELNNASFALALMVTGDGTKYYGLQAGAGGSLVPQGVSYTAGSYTLSGLTPGVTYQWTQGANDTSITIGSTTDTATGSTFVAPASGSVTLTGTGTSTVTASVAPFGVTTVGLPNGITITAGTISVSINAGVTSGGTATTEVVDFDSSFPASNVIPTGASYSSTGSYTLSGLVAGITYQWTQNANDTSITGVTLGTGGTFVAPSNGTVTLNGKDSDSITAVVAPDPADIPGGTIPGLGGLNIGIGTTSGFIDFTGPLVAVSGSLTLDLKGFIYVTGNLSFVEGGNENANLNLITGSTPSTTTVASMLEIGASDVTIFAGVNGPSTNSQAEGIELNDAGFALALISGNDGFTYYGLQATAASLSAIGLPSGFNLSGTNLGVQINGSNNGNGSSTTVVNFDSSFTNESSGNGLLVSTGGGNNVTLDFSTELVHVYGGLSLQFGSYISISGGFDYTQTSGTVTNIVLGSGAYNGASDLTFTLGTASDTLFTASGSLNMTITAGTANTDGVTTINSANLSVPEIKVADVLDVTSPSVTITNISIDNTTGAIVSSGNSTLTVTAATATLFQGSSILNGSVTQTTPGDPTDNGLSGTFDLVSGAFAVKLEVFTLNVSTVLTATADDVNITYSPGAGSSQQIVSIGSLSATFNGFGGGAITGNVTNLVIYGDGFKFDSATLSYSGDLILGSVLDLKDPSITLTDFSVTFDGTNTTLSASNLSVGVDSASVTVGAFVASATGLTITVSLTDGSTTIVADSLDFQFGSYLSLTGTGISINTDPGNGNDYLTVGSATAALNAGSFSVTGSATSFSVIDNNGTAEFQAGDNFSVTFTSPSSSSLLLPSWLGFSITDFEISWQGNNFNTDPSNFQITLSASITSIQGLPGGVTVSGEITDAVIDLGMLEKGEFPITSIGSVGGSVSGTLFGMQVNASFVLGIVQFNAQNEIVSNGTVTKLTTNSDGSVTETPDPSGSTTVVNSVMYVGVAGGAQIPGVGGVQIYIGFSSLGPLTVYLSAQFPLILDPDTGLAIGGFSGGVIFDYTIPTPQTPTDLETLALTPAKITISQWQQQLRDQTVTQYTSSNGGTNLTAAYSQPFVIEAGVTLYDAYLTADAFTLTGNIAIQINPASPDSTNIFLTGMATFGASVSFNAYLYLNITVSGSSSTATVMFLAQEPASTPVETIGGSLKFGFTDSNGNPITQPTVTSTIESEWIAAGVTYDSTGAASIGSLPAGTYTWAPGADDTSLTVGATTYTTATTFTTTAAETASLVGSAGTAVSGTLSSAGNVAGAQYTITTYTPPPVVGGFYLSLDGFAQFSAFGTLTATVSGSVTLTVTGTFAKIDLSGDLSVSGLGDLATASGELVVDYSGGLSSLAIYGALQLQTGSGFAQLQNIGLYVDGAATFILNTTDSPQTVYLPDPSNPHVPADATKFSITDTESFEVTIAGVGSTPANPTFASLSYKTGGDTILNMQGSFDLKISSSGLTMLADINSMSVGPSATPFLTFSGFGLFIINSQGFAAEMDVSLMASNIGGITMDAQFTLVMNTTQTAIVYQIPATLPPVTIPGTNNTVTSLTIPAGPPQGALQADGTYGTNIGPTGPYIVITGQGSLNVYSYSFTGFFYFQLSDSSAGPVAAMYLNVTGNLGFGQVSVTGGFDLSSAGVVVLLQASGSGGNTTNYGTGVSLMITAELAINTTDSPVSSIGGVALTDTGGQPLTLEAHSAQVVASGTLTLTFGPGSLVINGLFTTSEVTTGGGVTEVDTTTITANGTLTATVGGDTLLTGTASGVLVFAAPGPANPNMIGTNGLGLAGELTLTLSGSNPLSGNGFTFNGAFDVEVNTTAEAQQVMVPGSASPITISAGPNGSSFGSAYAEIHAYGTLLFGTNSGTSTTPDYNGFVLTGDFYLTVSTTGLAVSANVDLGVYVAGTSLVTVNGTAAMLISSSGFAASLVVTANVDDPNGLYGFDGTLSLQVNTTGAQQTIGTVVIPAASGLNGTGSPTGAPYFQVYISGALALGTTDATITASSTGMFVAGNFALIISPAGLSVAASGTLTAYVLGSPLLSMSANGALVINSAGMAGELTLTVSGGSPLDSTGLYSFQGNFNLQINTTGNNYYIGSDGTVYTTAPAPGTSYVTISAGPDGSTTTPGSFYVEVEASGTLIFGSASDGFSLAGNLFISVGAAGLEVSANAAFTANVLGTTLLTMNASGALIITSSGLAGELTLTFGVGGNDPLDGVGFSFAGTFNLVVNTTGQNYYIQSDGSISTTIPASGATNANTISAGPAGDTTTPGSFYFEIDANGTLLFGTASNGFALTGDLFLSIGSAGLAVSTNDTFSVNIGGSSVISLNASGAMEITSAGLAASLTLTASAGNDLFSNTSLPFGFGGIFTFQLNTTGKAIDDLVGNTQLMLSSGDYFEIYVNGSLGLGTSNTSASTGLFLNGTFYLTIGSNGLAIAATANLTATFDGATLLSLGASGGLVLTSNGLAGAITLTIGNGNSNPLSGTGFSFNGTFTLQVNTTGTTYYFWSNGTVSTNAPNPTTNPGVSVITTVSAGPGGSDTGGAYFQVYASGAITFGSSSNGFALSGSFYLAIGTEGLAISVTANFTATVLGTQLINVRASGAMEITSAGFAASISLTIPSMGINGVFTLSGSFKFQINTTDQAISEIGGVTVDLGAGPYFQVSVSGASLTFGGSGAGFGLTQGTFTLSVGSNGMAVSGSATLGLTVGGMSLASFSASGAMLITSNGIAAKLALTLNSGFSQTGSYAFDFQAAFVLELNTTSLAISTIAGQTVSLPRGPYFEILASGSLVMGGVVDITGSFTFTVTGSAVQITVNAALNVFGISFAANGFALISSSGLVLSINLSVGNSTNPTVTIIPTILALSGSFTLQINTTSSNYYSTDGVTYTTTTPGSGKYSTILAETVFNISISASLDVYGFSLATAAINITASTSGFSATGTTSFNFFGFVTFGVDFYFSASFSNSNVQYWFYGGAYVRLGSSGFNIHGSLTFQVSNMSTTDTVDINGVKGYYYGQTINNGITIAINGGVTAFDYNFASIGASISINGTDVSFSVYVSVSFYFFSIGGTVTIDLGSIVPVPSPPPPPNGTVLSSGTTIDGQTFNNGEILLINIGQYANSNRGVSPFNTESITISISGSTVTVTNPQINGGSSTDETYYGVAEIVVPDADIGNGTSNIDLVVTGGSLPVVVFAGSGNNTFNLTGTTSSGNTITINGTDGNDTVTAGGEKVIFNAGSGDNTFNGGAGTATITGSNGHDTIIGGTGNLIFNVGSGHSSFTGGGTGSTSNTINDPGSAVVIESGYNSYSLVGSSATLAVLTYGGNTDTLNNASGDLTVSLTGVASGSQTFSISNFWGTATLNANGNAAANVATTITSPSGNLTLTGNTVTESNGPTGTITLLNTASGNTYAYGTLNLDGGAGANTITVNSWTGSGAVTLDGMAGSDTYIINFQTAGSFTVHVADSGASGTDMMIANGVNNGTTLYVTNAAVTLGTQTATYSGIENLTVNTASTNETVEVSSTSASTLSTTINTGSYTDTVNVGSNAATTNTGGTLSGIASPLTVTGASSYDTLNLDDTGDTGAATGTLTSSTMTGGFFGANGSLSYSNIRSLNVNLGSGADTLNVTGTSSATTINMSLGTNTVNVGSNEPAAGGVLNTIKGALFIVGGGTTTLNVDDTGDGGATGILTASALKGLGMVASGITYSGLSVLTISLGNDGNIFTINNTYKSTTTTLNSGAGSDTVDLETDSGTTVINGQGGGDTINVVNDGGATTINESSGNNIINIQGTGATTNVNTSSGSNTINIGSKAPALTGNLNAIQGAINIAGSGTDTVNVGDTGSSIAQTGQLTSTTLTGLGMGEGITSYSGLQSLNILLGSGGNTFNILSTYSATVTTVDTGTGVNAVNITSNAPATTGGVVSGIAGELIINGQGFDTVNLNDTGDSAGGTLTQTTTTLSGLGMGPNGIVYSSIETLNISLGAGNDTVFIQGNPALTTENLNTGAGANIISIGSQAQSTIVTDTNPADGNTTEGEATNTGSVLDNVMGVINITGSGNDTLNVDDSGSTTAAEGGMWANKIEFLSPATYYTTLQVTITFTGLAYANISLSQAADEFVVTDTFTSASTTPVIVIDGNGGGDTFLIFDSHAVMTINGGSGDDFFYNFGNSAVLNLNGDAGNDTFYVYASVSASPTTVGALDSGNNKVYSYRLNSPVNIDGGTGDNSLFIFGTPLDDSFIITATSVTGAGLEINYTNIQHLTVEGLGGNDTFYIESISVPTTIYGDGTLVLPSVANFLNALNLSLPNLNGNAPGATSYNDTFYVGWAGASYIPGTLSLIDAPLTIYGDNGPNGPNGTTILDANTVNTIYVDDSSDIANQTFNLTSSTVNGGGILTGTGFGTGGSMTYDDAVEDLNFQTGNGNNTVIIDGNDTASQTSIYGGRGNDTFVVNDDYALQAPLALFGGLNTFPGDSLIVNGGASGNTFNVTGYTIDGLGATINYEEMEELTINAGGATTFTVNGDSVPTYLNGAAGSDNFTVNSNTVSLYLTSGGGNNTYTINANSGVLTATGDFGNDAGNDSVTVNANSGTLTLNGGAGDDVMIVNGNSGILTAYGDAGNDLFIVNALSAPATINGGTGIELITVNAPLAASLTVNGAGNAASLLTVNGISGNDYFTITGSSISGVGSPILYSRIGGLIVNGGVGNNTFLIESNSAPTTINGSNGNDVFYVQSTNAALVLNTNGITNTVDIGSQTPYPNSSVLYLLQGAVTVNGDGNDMLNLDDSADSLTGSGTLTADTFTGFGMATGGITYSGIATLNLTLGRGVATLNIQSINGATTTMVNTGAGADVLNIGSLEPLGDGVLSGILGPLTITGADSDTLNVDDTGDASTETGSLTPTTLTGLGMAATGIVFTGFNSVNIFLGQSGNTFAVLNTITGTTHINGGSGPDIFNIQATSGPLYLNGEGGSNTFNLGTGTLTAITSSITINGGTTTATRLFGFGTPGTNSLNIENGDDTTNETATLTSSTLSGLSLGGMVTFVSMNYVSVNLGSGNDQVNILGNNSATTTNIYGNGGANTAALNFSGGFAGNLTLWNFATATVSVAGNFSGTFTDAGAITSVTIGGALTAAGVLNAGSIGAMTVGGDLAGLLNVTGLLGSLTVNGGTPGQIIAGNVQVITVLAGYGNVVFNLTQGGIQREILALPVAGGALPGTIHFSFVYDAQSAAVPQVAIRITNTAPVGRSFNLELVVTNSATAQFNLARVDSYQNGKSGVSNISVDGSLLTKLTTPELQLFTDLSSNSPGGVVLPADSITAVELAGALPIGYVDVAGLEGLAFGVLTTAAGTAVSVSNPLGSSGNIQVLWNLLGSTPVLNAATDPFVVQFTAAQSVIVFAHVDTNPDFAQVMTLTNSISNNLPITATVQMVPTTNNSISPMVQSVALSGNGASISSNYSIANITSNGSIGNLSIGGTAGTTVNGATPGLGNVTATSIFGNIVVTNAGIYGIIQTTSGDIGQVNLGSNGQISSVTTITSNGAITGQIISRGNLISTVSTNSAFNGVIAAQGNIGVIQLAAGGTPVLSGSALIRFGGISITGADSGQVIALGNIFGNLTISGSMTGRVTAQGQSIAGLATSRMGILGYITATNFGSGAAIVSGGLIGDATSGTTVNLGNAKGFVAAAGAVNLSGTTITANSLIQNATGSNLTAISAIFTNNDQPLSFDTGGNLAGLALMESDLANLMDNGGVLSGTIL